MKDWIAYLRECVATDIWGLVLVDYYYHKVRPTGVSPSECLKNVVPQLSNAMANPVAFHRVLVCVAVQLFGSDFTQIFEQSLSFLRLHQQRLSSSDLLQISNHYSDYGRVQEFVEILTKNGFDTGASRSVVSSEERRIIPDPNLENRVVQAIHQVSTAAEAAAQSSAYAESFQASGRLKAENFVSILGENPIFNNTQKAMVSVGGADGAEVAYVLEHTEIRCAILLEQDAEALRRAHRRCDQIRDRLGKELVVLGGDAVTTINTCNHKLREWKANRVIDGVAYSINATLHELSARGSKKYDLRQFMHQVAQDWRPFLIAIREPAPPKDWPAKVELKCRNLSASTMQALASLIADRLRICSRDKIVPMSQGYVSMPRRLATETLFKLFHIDELPYEIEESVTSLPSKQLRSALAEVLASNCKTVYLNSPTFDRLYEAFGIECRNDKGQPELKPTAFVHLVGVRV